NGVNGIIALFSSRGRHTRFSRDWSSDVCSSDLILRCAGMPFPCAPHAIRLCLLPDISWAKQGGETRAANRPHSSFRAREARARRSEERRVGKESRTGGRRERQEANGQNCPTSME